MKKQLWESGENSSLPLLIVDREGIVGKALVERLVTTRRIVYVGREKPTEQNINLFYIPFHRHIPKLPNITFGQLFLFYYGEQSLLDALPSFVKKVERGGGTLFLIVPLSLLTPKLLTKIEQLPKSITRIFIGDVFGGHVPLRAHIVIHRYLHEVITKNQLLIQGDGLRKTYPVHIEDAVDALLTVAQENKHMSVFLFPQHPPTELALAHEFQRFSPLLRIDFRNIKTSRQILLPSSGKYCLPEFYSVRSRIKEERLWEQHLDETHLLDRPVSTFHNSFLRSVLLTVFFVFILPPLFTLMAFVSGLGFLHMAKTTVEQGNIAVAKQHAIIASNLFTVAQNTMEFVVIEGELVGRKEQFEIWQNRISTIRELSFATVSLFDTMGTIQQIYTGKTTTPKEDIYKAANDIKELILLYKKTQLEQKDFLTTYKIGMSLASIDPLATFFVSIHDVLPSLVGATEKKTYLVLFQNNMELRPGGGFIGSYGLMSLDKGRLVDFSVHDVYDADGQLKGHIEPPFAIRRHMPLVHLYLRDSNFYPDFGKSASTSAFLFHEETGSTVDGVVAVDVTFVKELVGALGSVYVPDYNETITAENFYERTQAHAEKDFFPGSTQKKEFLRSLYVAMQDTLMKKQTMAYDKLAKAVAHAVSTKHILFAFSDASTQRLFAVNGYSSTLLDERKEDSGTINDFLAVSEANLGVNKANLFVKRKIEQHVTITDTGTTQIRAVVRYINASSTWPGGDYKNYLRFIIPLGSKLTGIQIDGEEQAIVPAVIDPAIYEAKRFVAPTGLEVEQIVESDKESVGFLITIPHGGNKVVAITYEHPKTVSSDSPAMIYDTKVIKQPGTDDDPFLFTLTFPKTYKVANATPRMQQEDSGLRYISSLDTDKHLRLLFSKK